MRRGFLLFRPDDGNGGGGTPPPTPPAADPPATPPAGDPPPAGKVFTQAELDAIVQKEKAKAEKSAREAAAAEASKAKLDEVERLKLEKQESDQRAADAVTRANGMLLTAKAELTAAAAGATGDNVEAVVKLADLSGIDVSEDGTVDAKALAAAITLVKGKYPALFGQTGGSRSGGDFQGGGDGNKRVYTEAEIKAMSPLEFAKHQEDILAAQREGRIRG